MPALTDDERVALLREGYWRYYESARGWEVSDGLVPDLQATARQFTGMGNTGDHGLCAVSSQSWARLMSH